MNYLEMKKKALLSGVFKDLPYIELEYIEGTGEQYINTGIIADSNTGIMSITAYTGWRDRADGVYEDATKNNRLYPPYLSSASKAGYGWNNYISITTAGSFGLNVFYQAQTNFKNCGTYSLACDTEVLYQGVIADKNSKTENISPICIFTSFVTAATRQKARKKQFVITKGEQIVFDAVPAIRKSDNEIGMYDKVSGQFFTNQGTGEFLYKEKQNETV